MQDEILKDKNLDSSELHALYSLCLCIYRYKILYALTETALCFNWIFNLVLSKSKCSLKMAKIQTHQLIFLFHINKHLKNMNIAVYTAKSHTIPSWLPETSYLYVSMMYLNVLLPLLWWRDCLLIHI